MTKDHRQLVLMHLGEAGNRCYATASELRVRSDRFAWRSHLPDIAKSLRVAADALDRLATAGQPTAEEKRVVKKIKANLRVLGRPEGGSL